VGDRLREGEQEPALDVPGVAEAPVDDLAAPAGRRVGLGPGADRERIAAADALVDTAARLTIGIVVGRRRCRPEIAPGRIGELALVAGAGGDVPVVGLEVAGEDRQAAGGVEGALGGARQAGGVGAR
jgi:hypothetical protein